MKMCFSKNNFAKIVGTQQTTESYNTDDRPADSLQYVEK
jgi:hypothetical protein